MNESLDISTTMTRSLKGWQSGEKPISKRRIDMQTPRKEVIAVHSPIWNHLEISWVCPKSHLWNRTQWHQASESLHRSSLTGFGATMKPRMGTGQGGKKDSEKLPTINQDSERIAIPLWNSKLLLLQMCAIQQIDWKDDIMFMDDAGDFFPCECRCVSEVWGVCLSTFKSSASTA